jgi:hypothetical protein
MPPPPASPPADDALSSGDDGDGYAGGGSVAPNMSSRLKYQVRREEKGARLASPMGLGQSKPIRAPSVDVVPGMKRGGPVAALNTSRTPMQPSAGTTGPGSGYGDVAAPPVSRYANGGSVDDPTENLLNSFYKTNQDQIARNTAQASMPMRSMGDAGGSANAATGSGGDAAGGASGTGGVGGSATDGAGGSAAAGVGGDDGGTYRRGGGVRRYADGGAVGFGSAFTNAAMRGSRQATAQHNPYNRYDTPPPPTITRTASTPVPNDGTSSYAEGGPVDRFRSDDREEAYKWAEGRTPPRTIARQDREVTPPPPAYEPGDTGELPRDQPAGDDHYADAGGMPPVTVTAKRDRPAGPARRRQLGDQSRTAAYDPEADRMDPRNTNITEPGGAVNERVWRATPEAHPDAYPDDNKGMFGERLDRPGPNPVPAEAGTGSAINLGAPTTPTAPAQDNYAVKGASRFATNMFPGEQGEHALFAGKGAPPPTEVQGVFKTIDPDDKMPLHEKMVASTKAVHDYWMAKGDPKQADQAAFEIAQFGNTMARQHGAKALKAMQGGDQNGALNELMAGYGWLPDGGTPEVKGNAIVIRDAKGTVTTTIPLQPGTLQNLALGMSTGQLGWDVMHSGAGRQVTSGPTAQPQAAPAGPQPTPAAPTAPPAPPPTQGPPPPPTQGPAPPPTQAPAPPPTQAPVPQMGPEGAPQAISTTPPQAAPPPAPQATPTARPAAPAPPPAVSTQGQGQRVPPQGDGGPPGSPSQPPAQKTPEQQKAEQDDAEQKDYAKNPYGARRVANSAEAERDRKIAQARDDAQREIAEVMKKANAHGLTGKGKLPAVVNQVIGAKKKKYEDDVKMIEADYRADHAERQRQLQPRNMSLNDYTTIDTTFAQRSEALAKAKSGSAPAQFRDDSVLRYAKGDDQQTIKDIATNIWQHNKGLSPQQALDLALTTTSIMRPTPDDKDPVGQNRQKGEKATRFKALNQGDKGVTSLRFGDGTDIRVDNNTYQRIAQQHAENWRRWAESQTKEGKDKAAREKNRLGWGTLESGIRTIAPFIPGPGVIRPR